jgi:hypothetical protein
VMRYPMIGPAAVTSGTSEFLKTWRRMISFERTPLALAASTCQCSSGQPLVGNQPSLTEK